MRISEEPFRVCYFGTYRANYSRNQIMIEGLRRSNVHVVECHESLWFGVEDRVAVAIGGWRNLRFWIRVVRTYLCLLAKYRKVGYYDFLIVGYPGQFDVYLARLLSWLRRKPMVWDVFMSIYLIGLERGIGQRSKYTLNLIRIIEKIALHLPDLLIQDTEDYVNWLVDTHGVLSDKFVLIPTGADDREFHPIPLEREEDGCFRVIYYGTFILNHGVEYIIEAAHLLFEENIKFIFIGTGPERTRIQKLASEFELTNVIFIDWLEKPALVKRVAQADICLGAFGNTPQSLMTIQNKIYEGLAMGKPVLTGDSKTIRRAFQHSEHIYLCTRASPESIAEAIVTLRNNPDLLDNLSNKGYAHYQANFSLENIGFLFRRYLEQLL